MSKHLLNQREIAVIKHVWSLTELEAGWLDKYQLKRSKVADVIIFSKEKQLKLDNQLFQIIWTTEPTPSCKMDDPVLLSFRAHYNSRTQVVLCHIVKSQLSCKSIELPEYEP